MLAAVALPAYQDYTVRARIGGAIIGSQGAREALSRYYESHQKVPESLSAAGIASQLADGSEMKLDPQRMVLTVTTKQGDLVFTPAANAQGHIVWGCTGGEGIKPAQLPSSCRELVAPPESRGRQ
jgi:type IV pilus assembly protein PilA